MGRRVWRKTLSDGVMNEDYDGVEGIWKVYFNILYRIEDGRDIINGN